MGIASARTRPAAGFLLCILAACLAGCSSLPTGELALSRTGPTEAISGPPSILPTEKPKTATTWHSLAPDADTEGGDAFDDGLGENDPFEPIGRGFHQLNRGIDFVVMRPFSAVYNTALPRPVRNAVRNGFRQLRMPAQIANYLLQGDVRQAGQSLERTFVNFMIGFGGLADPASKRRELQYRPTDFGVTLGRWGVGEGVYFEAPLIGPTTTRSSIGRIVDIALNPISYITFFTDMGTFSAVDAIAPGIRVGELMEMRARNADLVDEILYASPDTYVTLRTVFLQNRRAKLAGGVIDEANLPEILEFTAPALR
ncbi:MAG: VacJ family lipoprotein [Pseudomonadota bacterium]